MIKNLLRGCALVVAVSISACFSPEFQDGKIQCSAGNACPPGLMCYAGTCRVSDPGPQDAPNDQTVNSTVTLTITGTGNGVGTVISVPTGISCGADCTETYPTGTQVTLLAAPGTSSLFGAWGGACSGSTTTCSLTLNADTTVTASFPLVTHTVTVVSGGNGAGTVTSTPAGLTCPGSCSVQVAHGGSFTLNGAAAGGSTFIGWSGGNCVGNGPCAFTVDADVTVNASFGLNNSVVVTRIGNGTGTVTSAPAGINCGSDCDEAYSPGATVTLTATPNSNSTFGGWSGACTGNGTCMLTVNAAQGVTALFNPKRFDVDVTLAGLGIGTVTGSGINCPGDCSETVDIGTTMTLTAMEGTGSVFTGWSGACAGMSSCVVSVNAPVAVTATFARATYPVSVAIVGSGVVSSSPSGILCPGDCSESYVAGTTVVLTPMASIGSTFMGWSGACVGNGTCTVNVMAMSAVTATFTVNQVTLTTVVSGTGMGSVTSAPAGISCAGDCMETLPFGSMLTLTATPMGSSTFAGWSGGGCGGTGTTCVVTFDMSKTVTASFSLNQVNLTVTTIGNGMGTVTSNPLGISCPGTCIAGFAANTPVALTAMPTVPGSVFAGWSGACSGFGACNVTMDVAKTVTANFKLTQHTLSVSIAGTGTGTVIADLTGINCPGDCMEDFDFGTKIQLTATPTMGQVFMGWMGGGCSGTDVCIITIAGATSVTATFSIPTYTLTVTKTGNGTGTVSAGTLIDCGLDCMETLDANTVISLVAAPTTSPASADSVFTGWANAPGCTTNLSCVVTMSASINVRATFSLRPNKMFVTAATFTGNLGGLAAADMQCQNAAGNASLGGTVWKAFLSSSSSDVNTRFAGASGWVRTDGKPFANTLGDLVNGRLYYPPTITQGGTTIPLGDNAWTGTNGSGALASECGVNWSSTAGNGTRGLVASASGMALSFGVMGCTAANHLYCFELDRAATVVPPVLANVRRAFQRVWQPGMGFLAADAACQADAMGAGLPGSYKALLAVTGASALSRFDTSTTAQPWARVDNVLILPTANAWTTASAFDTGPNVSANGMMWFSNYGNWGGAADFNTAGTTATTCNNWTDPTMTAYRGNAGNTILNIFWQAVTQLCNFNSNTITCLQQ